eukprot:TRINITY_DN4780_c0_g1_i1.p1 TRINITY_DN4780_c0_g1~~TRINITY_DN4780_c0_g1_i1.p1  ORF type:complete len:252 (+),score=26.45 TRINITY_DN4780_c0_g1_i1:20-775(+)
MEFCGTITRNRIQTSRDCELWNFVEPSPGIESKQVEIVNYGIELELYRYSCAESSHFTTYLLLSIAALYLVISLFIGWQIHHLQTRYNENRNLFVCVAVCAFFSVVLLPTSSFITTFAGLYMLLSLGILFGISIIFWFMITPIFMEEHGWKFNSRAPQILGSSLNSNIYVCPNCNYEMNPISKEVKSCRTRKIDNGSKSTENLSDIPSTINTIITTLSESTDSTCTTTSSVYTSESSEQSSIMDCSNSASS